VTAGSLTELEELLGYQFTDRSLLATAVTHPSWAEEAAGEVANYQRLEFLGDTVVNLVSARGLFDAHPDATEAVLSRIRGRVVSTRSLARASQTLGLGRFLRLGVGEERSGGRGRRALLADVFEAVAGALFVDGGPDVAFAFVHKALADAFAGEVGDDTVDYKGRLQELTQAQDRSRPVYRDVGREGPDHEATFVVEAVIFGARSAEGRGASRKAAQQAAARTLWQSLTRAAENATNAEDAAGD
jgi:ribonuclease-3